MDYQPHSHIPFYKMQGTGNDFVIIDNRMLQLSKKEIGELAPEICNRNYGVGSDGIIALLSAEQEEVDYTMFYLNPDGSDAGMCGNGARCMALLASSQGFDNEHTFNVHNRVYKAIVKENSVTLSFPIQATIDPLSIDNQQFFSVHTGTDHLVTTVDEDTLTDEQYLRDRGRELRYHSRFQPRGTNVNFIFGVDTNRLKLQTYERGVEGLTFACGTGAIASALVWHHLQNSSTSNSYTYAVKIKGGELRVHFTFSPVKRNYSNIKLEGPAHFVFKGKYML